MVTLQDVNSDKTVIESLLMSIKIRIREVAVSRGIKTAYRLQKTADLAPSSAARLFRNEVREISVETMTKLCDALDCEPGELFVKRETIPKGARQHHAQAKRKSPKTK